MNKIIPISGLAMVLALGFMRSTGAVESQRRATSQPAPQQEARILGHLGDEALIAPATVMAGKDFQITVTTTGGGCERAGDTGVILSNDSATVMVYDFTTATHPDVACTMIFKRLQHTVTLRFTKPGSALIRIWGRKVGSDTGPIGAPTVIERSVTVK
jgi:hypothetical protein